MTLRKIVTIFFTLQFVVLTATAQSVKSVKTVFVDSGWANNSVNTVVFRKYSLCTYKNTQYISFYNQEGFVVIGKRKSVALIFIDEERQNKVSAAVCNDLSLNRWEITDLSNASVGSWEPSFDTNSGDKKSNYIYLLNIPTGRTGGKINYSPTTGTGS